MNRCVLDLEMPGATTPGKISHRDLQEKHSARCSDGRTAIISQLSPGLHAHDLDRPFLKIQPSFVPSFLVHLAHANYYVTVTFPNRTERIRKCTKCQGCYGRRGQRVSINLFFPRFCDFSCVKTRPLVDVVSTMI